MRIGLYQKFFGWFLCNMVLLGLVVLLFSGWMLFGNSNGLYSPQLFSGNINAVIRMASVELQYKPTEQWAAVLEETARECNLDMGLVTLDVLPENMGSRVPERLIRVAQSLPRPPYTLCAEPESGAAESITPTVEMEAGLLPPQYALFIRDGDPARYWYARTLLVPDENATMRYVLLATASSNITGNGLYFDVYLPLAAIVITLGLSVIWWWPFVHHVSSPLQMLTCMAERMAGGDYSSLSGASGQQLRYIISDRHDEIGRLAAATAIMAKKVRAQVHGQRRFIRHIAHELGSPLARIQLGLAVLDERLEGDAKHRVKDIYDDVEQLSELVNDVLSFMRSEAIPEQPRCVCLDLLHFVHEAIGQEARGACLILHEPATPLNAVWSDEACLRKALNNLLRNAVHYAGKDNPINITVEQQGGDTLLEIADSGPGVNEEEIPHLMEPFYRGSSSVRHPGGSGLGLSIVKHCIGACGGSVTCRNAVPHGFVASLRFKTGPSTSSDG